MSSGVSTYDVEVLLDDFCDPDVERMYVRTKGTRSVLLAVAGLRAWSREMALTFVSAELGMYSGYSLSWKNDDISEACWL